MCIEYGLRIQKLERLITDRPHLADFFCKRIECLKEKIECLMEIESESIYE